MTSRTLNDETWSPRQRLIGGSIELIGQHCQSSDQLVRVQALLLNLHNRGRITSRRRLKTLASYNGLTKTITLSSRKLPFLDFDYHSRLQNLATSSEIRLKLETLRFRQLIQLSGLLVHEGQHALQPIRSWWSPRKARALDEQQALGAEQLWYQLLYERVAPNYHDEVYDLSKSAERDAQTAQAYSRLRLSAPCLIQRVIQRDEGFASG